MSDTATTAGDAGSTEAAAAEARKRAAPSNFLPIVRGRLPLLFVHAIRFDKTLASMGTKDLASKFSTSVGKVFDIKKGRNFAYVGEAWKPTEADIQAAEAWIGQVGGENAKGLTAAGDKSVMQTTLESYKARGLATPEDVAAFAAAKAAAAPAAAPAPADGSAPAAPRARGGKKPAAAPAPQDGAGLLS